MADKIKLIPRNRINHLRKLIKPAERDACVQKSRARARGFSSLVHSRGKFIAASALRDDLPIRFEACSFFSIFLGNQPSLLSGWTIVAPAIPASDQNPEERAIIPGIDDARTTSRSPPPALPREARYAFNYETVTKPIGRESRCLILLSGAPLRRITIVSRSKLETRTRWRDKSMFSTTILLDGR